MISAWWGFLWKYLLFFLSNRRCSRRWRDFEALRASPRATSLQWIFIKILFLRATARAAPTEFNVRTSAGERCFVPTWPSRHHAHHYTFYFWLNPKVTKDQEPIKGDFAFGKPRTLFTAPCFYRGSVRLLLISFV